MMTTQRLLSFGAALLFATAPQASAASFWDVPADHPNAEAIAYVREHGIVAGYPDGSYRPDQTINRAEFTKIVAGSLGEKLIYCTLQPFRDVPIDAWYAPYVCAAKNFGLVSGYPDGTFRGNNTITFVEAAKILEFGASHDRPVYCGLYACPEYPTADHPWYEKFVRILSNKTAIPLSIARLEQPITRGEMAEMQWRIILSNIGQERDWTARTYEELAGISPEKEEWGFHSRNFRYKIKAVSGEGDCSSEPFAAADANLTSPESFTFDCVEYYAPDFTAHVLHVRSPVLTTSYPFDEACGSLSAQKTLVNRIVHTSLSQWHLERQQEFNRVQGGSTQLDYCFDLGSTILRFRFTVPTDDLAKELPNINKIIDSVEIQDPEPSPGASVDSSLEYLFEDIKVGQRVGGFVVTKTSGTSIQFSGEITVTGTYSHRISEFGSSHNAICMTKIEEPAALLLPIGRYGYDSPEEERLGYRSYRHVHAAVPGEPSRFFCFDAADAISKGFPPDGSGQATVTFNDYEMVMMDMGGTYDSATLVKVVQIVPKA